ESPVPLTRQIYEFWRAGIVSGRFGPGERVPSTREVATALALARGTIAQAYEQLVSEGYFQATRGSGTFVSLELPEAAAVIADERGERAENVGDLVRLSSLGEELRKDSPPARRQEGYISLSPAGPDISLFPLDLWRRLYVRTLKSIGTHALDYA